MKTSHIFFTLSLLSSISGVDPLYAGKDELEAIGFFNEVFGSSKKSSVSLKHEFSGQILETRKVIRKVSEKELIDFKTSILRLVNTLDKDRQSISARSTIFKAFFETSKKTKLSYPEITEELVKYINPQTSDKWDEDFILAYLELRQVLAPQDIKALLPSSIYGALDSYSYNYSAQNPKNLSELISVLSPEEIQFGIKTLTSKKSIKAKIDHFEDIKKYLLRSASLENNDMERRLKIADKIQVHTIPSVPNLFKALLTFENLKDTAFVIDLHGVLTVKSEPKLGETTVPARGFTVELLKDLHHAGATLILSSAWNSFSDILEQLTCLGLEKVFGLSNNDTPKKGIHKTETGDFLDYQRIGNIISVKWANSNGYWKEKMFAPDIIGLMPKRIVLIDDSGDNIQKGTIHITETKAGLGAANINLFYINPLDLPQKITSLEMFSLSCHEENKLPEEADLGEWEKKWDLKSELRTFPESLEKRKKQEEQRLLLEEENQKRKEEQMSKKQKNSQDLGKNWQSMTITLDDDDLPLPTRVEKFITLNKSTDSIPGMELNKSTNSAYGSGNEKNLEKEEK
ncbi:Putative inorganic pyrophosphatase domain protein [Candidatus Bealeia paramacronuclearis]|uniref:Inorganic pyrophosphatase domain protein n=1 Tax=Candidatus Bealeia paramacronuclearis TaxID=1921001 RepID=A0ABZ2C3N9_9PROT|nr:putative inorganic pyrophosphatase domain protein [Candidatus Bealeia paramacronuclearis]